MTITELEALLAKPEHDAYYIGSLRISAADLIADHKAMREALQLLHDNLAEYQRINNIDGYDNQDMVQARSALSSLRVRP